MGNSQTLSCTSGEKGSKAQQKEERYQKKPVENGTGTSETPANGTSGDGEVVAIASSEVPEETEQSPQSKDEPKTEDSKPADNDNNPPANTEEEPAAASTSETTQSTEKQNESQTAEAKSEETEAVKAADAEENKPSETELRIEEPEDKKEEPQEASSESNECSESKPGSNEVKEADAEDSLSQAVLSALSSETKVGSGVVDSTAVEVVVNTEEPESSVEEPSTAAVEASTTLPERETNTALTSSSPPSVEEPSSVSHSGDGNVVVDGGSEPVDSSADNNEPVTETCAQLNDSVTVADSEANNSGLVNGTDNTEDTQAQKTEEDAAEADQKTSPSEEVKPDVDESGDAKAQVESSEP